MQVDGTAGKAPTPFIQYAGLRPTNPAACNNTSVYGQVFGHLPSGWVAVGGPDTKSGGWNLLKGCVVPRLAFPQMTGYDKIAIAGVAYSDLNFNMVNVTDGAQ